MLTDHFEISIFLHMENNFHAIIDTFQSPFLIYNLSIFIIKKMKEKLRKYTLHSLEAISFSGFISTSFEYKMVDKPRTGFFRIISCFYKKCFSQGKS